MLYIKVLAADGSLVAAEAHASPVYVRYQEKNSLIIRCSAVKAQGIVSVDGSTVYQLYGKDALPGVDLTAHEITMTECDELAASLAPGDEDPEDETPVVPEGGSESEILTRAELTAKVAELEEELAAAKILLGVE